MGTGRSRLTSRSRGARRAIRGAVTDRTRSGRRGGPDRRAGACDGGRRAADGSALETGSGREACGVGIGARADRDRPRRRRPSAGYPDLDIEGAVLAARSSGKPEAGPPQRLPPRLLPATIRSPTTTSGPTAETGPSSPPGDRAHDDRRRGTGDGCRRPVGGDGAPARRPGALLCCRGEPAASTSSRRCCGGPASGSGRSRSSPVGRWMGTLSARPRSARRTTWLSSRRATNRGRSHPAGRSRCRRATICSSSGAATRSTGSWRWPRDSRPRRNGWCRRDRGRSALSPPSSPSALRAAAAGGGHPRHVRRPRRPRRGECGAGLPLVLSRGDPRRDRSAGRRRRRAVPQHDLVGIDCGRRQSDTSGARDRVLQRGLAGRRSGDGARREIRWRPACSR